MTGTLYIGKRHYTNRDALTERFGRIYRIPKHWSENGCPTRLWLIDYHSREVMHEVHDQLDIVSTPVFGWRFFRELVGHLRGRFNRKITAGIVVASGDCYIGLLGRLVAASQRATFVFDVYDKYDEFGAYRRLPGFDPLTSLLRRADLVSFASRALHDRLAGITRRATVVTNGVDLKHFRPLDTVSCRETFALPKQARLVGYFGSMETERGVADLVAAVRMLRETGQDLELVLGGHCDDRSLYTPAYVHYLGNLPFEQVPVALGSCNVLALPYRHSLFLDMASSCKIGEYIAVGRPLLATATPNLLENFPQQVRELGNRLAAPGNVESLAICLALQLDEPVNVTMPDNMQWSDIAAAFRQDIDSVLAEQHQ